MTFTIPIQTVSLANSRMHWAEKARVVKRQRSTAKLLTASAIDGHLIPDALTVTMTRVTPPRGKQLDTDNLSSALKPVRDGIADALGIDDGDESVTWVCRQERGTDYAVRVAMEGR